jgi:hypothetical protein
MEKLKVKICSFLALLAVFYGSFFSLQPVYSQDSRWLRIGEAHTFINEIGAEYENELTTGNTCFLNWPSLYGNVQQTTRSKALWIGCNNFDDPVEGIIKRVKVISSGPRNATEVTNMIFERELNLVGKYERPIVLVDNAFASVNEIYDILDSLDENLPADRMVLVKFNTSMGITVTKKVLAFSHPDHDNYFLYDFVFENTGIINREGETHSQRLENVWFYFLYRYAFAGESRQTFNEQLWGSWNSTWGENTLNHAFGQDPNGPDFTNPLSLLYQLRGFYSYAGPDRNRTTVTREADWGCPNQLDDGIMASAKYTGCVTLHSDTDPDDQSDDLYQPATTHYLSSDINIVQTDVSQYNEAFMDNRFTAMTEGHPDQQHDEYVGERYPADVTDNRRNTGGGTSQGQGFGPYTMDPGDSIHIVFAEGVSGISRQKNREVGANWLQYFNSTGMPALIMPDGNPATTDNVYGYAPENAYKRAWIETGIDSILKTYSNATAMYQYLYNDGPEVTEAPPPPNEFRVASRGDRISLSWADNASTTNGFDGYVIYRSEGNVMDPKTVYRKIFECNASDAVHQFEDITANRGFDYYYYIQTKARDASQGGRLLYSSAFWTLTSVPANLLRPAGTSLAQVRVVPNPYDIRARMFQFGEDFQYDRLAFYGIPGICKLRIFTERGDLIWEKYHDNGSGDELWDSKTSSGQIVVSGIYILLVEVMENITNEESGELVFRKGETVYRKFVIIR